MSAIFSIIKGLYNLMLRKISPSFQLFRPFQVKLLIQIFVPQTFRTEQNAKRDRRIFPRNQIRTHVIISDFVRQIFAW